MCKYIYIYSTIVLEVIQLLCIGEGNILYIYILYVVYELLYIVQLVFNVQSCAIKYIYTLLDTVKTEHSTTL